MNMLSLFPAIPLLMMLGLWLSKSTRQIRAVMVAGSSLLLLLAAVLVVRYLGLREAGETAAMLFTASHVWYAPLDIHYAVGVDGISVAMLLLSAVIVFTGTFASWRMQTQIKEYFLWFCLLSVGVFGFFISVDLFTMFMFYEVALIPMYLLIGVWGSGRKEYAAMKLTLMLMGGSALLLIGILGIYFGAGATTMNILEIAQLHSIPLAQQYVWFPLVFVGFGVLGALFPFHTWSPDGHASAPTAVSMLHAGVLMKLGGYGCFRVAMYLMPEAVHELSWIFIVLTTISVVYGALAACVQTDLKYINAYSSVSHCGLVLFAILMMNTTAGTGANAPRWSLLGATLIAIFSFLPLYLAPSSVAEIVKPLFVVLALSLLLSWVLALTQTPLFGNFMLKVKPVAGDPYDTRFYRAFDRLLAALLRWRWAVAATVAGLFVLSLAVMGLMPQNFFPSLDKPYFRADVLLPDGYNIRDTERNLLAMEEWLRAQPEVKTVSMTLGSTPPRYYLASSSISLRPNFGNILVELHDKRQTEAVEERFNAYVTANFPDVWLRSSLFKLSPVPDAAIEFGFIGDDVDTLRRLAARAEEVMWRTPGAVNIRNGWGNRVPMWQPVYSQMKGQRIGITRSQMARGITIATQGYTLGEYREGDQFMPILLKDENIGSYNLTNLQALPIFNPSGKVFSIEQATDGFRFDFRPGVIKRFNRQRVMKAQCDPGRGVNTMQLFAALRDSVDRAVVLPEGYSMKVFGEQESQQESNEALAEYMPLTLVLILIVLLLLFRNYREPVVILCCIVCTFRLRFRRFRSVRT